MNYMEEFELKLRQLLSANDIEAVVRFVKERHLQSYLNGQASRSKARPKREDKAPGAIA